ncbi:hypothetical protein Misp04_08980 [Micromonospora sp. NBRC 101691]|nr:hypothetical protein Misp04_08980 [Micromonospora sp. NBRC 101691]
MPGPAGSHPEYGRPRLWECAARRCSRLGSIRHCRSVNSGDLPAVGREYRTDNSRVQGMVLVLRLVVELASHPFGA